MSKKTLAAGAAALALVLGLSACGSSDNATAGGTTVDETTVVEDVQESDAAAQHNAGDVMFAQMMIPHHAQAVEMSDILLAKEGISDEMVLLAEQIKAAQAPELAQLTGWLEQWGEPLEMPGEHDMSTMEGMLSEQDLQDLTDAQGVDASKLFLEQMIGHHEGAITMAEDELADGLYPDALAMARVIIDTQQQEIDDMRELLTTL